MPGAPEPRLTLLRRQGFKIGISNRLRGLSNRSIVVVCNYCSGPITAEPYRAKARPLHPRRSYFAPIMVEAPGTAPGSEWLIATAIYRHSWQASASNISANRPRRKSGRSDCVNLGRSDEETCGFRVPPQPQGHDEHAVWPSITSGVNRLIARAVGRADDRGGYALPRFGALPDLHGVLSGFAAAAAGMIIATAVKLAEPLFHFRLGP